MLSYTIRRLTQIAVVMIGLSILIFLLFKMIPGDIALVILGSQPLGGNISESLAAIRHEYGLDRSLPAQYFALLRGIFTGRLQSTYFHQSVASIIMERIPKTAELSVVAFSWAVLVSIFAGVIAAMKKDSLIDHIVTSIAILGYCIPDFWSALLLMLLFGVQLQWLPISGRGETFLGLSLFTVDGLRHLIIPAFALGLIQMCLLTRLTRANMLEVLNDDYIRTARAKGVKERVVVWKHAFRTASLPVLTNVGMMVGRLLSGAVLVETVTAWPGVGRLMYQALMRKDEPLVFGLALFLGLIYMLSYLAIDILYAFVDPRIVYD